jgi:hypothetical protein
MSKRSSSQPRPLRTAIGLGAALVALTTAGFAARGLWAVALGRELVAGYGAGLVERLLVHSTNLGASFSVALASGLVAALLLGPVWVEAKRARRRLQVCALGALSLGMVLPAAVSLATLGLPAAPEAVVADGPGAAVLALADSDFTFTTKTTLERSAESGSPEKIETDEAGFVVGDRGQLQRAVTVYTCTDEECSSETASRERNMPPTEVDAEQQAEEARLAELGNKLAAADPDSREARTLREELSELEKHTRGVILPRTGPLRDELGWISGWREAAAVPDWELVGTTGALTTWRGRRDPVASEEQLRERVGGQRPGPFAAVVERARLRAEDRGGASGSGSVIFEVDLTAEGKVAQIRWELSDATGEVEMSSTLVVSEPPRLR